MWRRIDVSVAADRAIGAEGTGRMARGNGAELVRLLGGVVGEEAVVAHEEELVVYECDGFTIPRARPLAVVFPRTTEQVVGVVNALREYGVAITARGSGTGLAGGMVAVVPSVQVSVARMNRV